MSHWGKSDTWFHSTVRGWLSRSLRGRFRDSVRDKDFIYTYHIPILGIDIRILSIIPKGRMFLPHEGSLTVDPRCLLLPEPLLQRWGAQTFGDHLITVACCWPFTFGHEQIPAKPQILTLFLSSSDISWIPNSNFHMGVSKNRGTPKWMVYNGKPY